MELGAAKTRKSLHVSTKSTKQPENIQNSQNNSKQLL